MKRYLILYLLLTCLLSIGSAQKHDYFWLFGYASNPVDSSFGGTNFDFNSSPPDISYIYREMNIGSVNASICDEDGNLLFYSNGCEIADANQNLLINGDSINPGDLHNDFCYSLGSYPMIADMVVLPFPDNQYKLIHKSTKQTFHDNPPSQYTFASDLMYTQIDMNSSEVIQKNTIILQDTFVSNDLNAVKHANGNDWWFFARKPYTNIIHKFLATEDTVVHVEDQSIGTALLWDNGGQAIFSPDGTKYVYHDLLSDIMIYDFDRETGQLSNFINVPLADSAVVLGGGAAISSNSRFLYVSNILDVYQLDLWAADIESSVVHIASFDGFASPFFATNFYRMQLAPDCKIYINSVNAVDYLHVIHFPNEKGIDCEIEQHAIKLATINSEASFPTYPNYRIDTEEICDSTISMISQLSPILITNNKLRIYPNPVKESLKIKLEGNFFKSLKLYDVSGKALLENLYLLESQLNFDQISMAAFPPGIYFLEVFDGTKVYRKKILKR